MKVALTGAGGFLGGMLLKQFAMEPDFSVVAFSSKASLPAGTLLGDRLSVLPATSATQADSYAGVDVVLNCAFPRNTNGEAIAAGLKYLDEVFLAAAEAHVGAVVNISSQSVYSQRRTSAAIEDEPLFLEGEYAVAKYASELLLDARCAGIPRTNIRLASLVGAGFDQRVLNKLIKRVVAGGNLSIQESGYRYGYMDARDTAQALTALLKSDASRWAPVYNLGPKDAYTLTEMAQSICRYALEKRSQQVEVSYTVAQNDAASACSALDSSLFEQHFAWKGSFGLDDTVEAIFCYEAAKEGQA